MEEDIKIVKELIEEIKRSLKADFLVNPAEHLKERASKIVDKKKREVEALENIIQRIEDLYE